MTGQSSNYIFDLFFENSIGLLCIADTNGIFIKLNPQWSKTLGYELSELEGKPFIEFVHPEDVENTLQATRQLADQQIVQSFTNRFRHKTGDYRWIEWRSYPVDNMIYASALDITERVLAEDALKVNEQKYRLLFENMTSAFALHSMIYDEAGEPVDYRFIEINPAYEQLTGLTKDALVGHTVKEVLPFVEEYWIKTFGNVAKKGIPIRYINYVKELGRYYDTYSFQPTEGQFAVVFNEITDRVKIENELRASEQKFSNIFNLSPDMVGISRRADGMLLSANPAFSQVTGYSPEEFIGHTTLELNLWANSEQRKTLTKLLNDKGEVRSLEMELRIKNGSILTCLFSATPLEYNNEPCLIYVMHDITERFQAEKMIRRSEARLQKAQIIGQIGYSEQEINSERLWASAEGKRIFGFEPVDGFVMFEDVRSCIQDFESFRTSYYELIENEKNFDLELFINPRDGSPQRFVHFIVDLEKDSAGKTVKIITIFQDITKHKKTEDALQKRVIALTRPLDDPEGVKFTDLFNIEDLQRIQDTFSDATGVASIITYPDGTPITRPSNFTRICNMIRSTKLGKINCQKSDAVIGQQNIHGPVIQPCLSGGIWDAGAGITLGGKHMANWLIGQVRDESQNDDKLLSYADRIGVDREQFRQALHELPSMTREQFGKVAQSLFVLANELSIKAYQNVQQARIITERTKIEEALRESERNYREIFNATSDALFLHEVPSGQVIDVNESMMRMYGYKNKKEVIALSVQVFCSNIPPYTPVIALQKLQQTVNEGPQTFEWLARNRSGKLFWTEVSTVATKIGGVDRVIASTRNINERKEAESALLKSESLLKATMESMTDGILIVTSDGKITHSNSHFQKIFKVPGELMTVSKDSLILEQAQKLLADPDSFTKRVEAIYKTQLPTEDILHFTDGRIIERFSFPLRDESPLKGRVWLFRDITERRMNEVKLAEKDAKLRSIFLAAPVGIGLSVNRIIRQCNDAFYLMTGYQPEEIIGQNTRKIYVTEEEFTLIDQKQNLEIKEQKVETVETRWLRKDGSIINILLSFVPINASDLSKGISFSALDITERKKSEEALWRSQERFSKSFHSSPAAMAISEIDTGNFIDVNDCYLNMFGYTRNELIEQKSKSFEMWIQPSIRYEIVNQIKMRGYVKEFEVQMRTKSGAIRDVQWSGVSIVLEGQSVLLSYNNDITDRKLAESEVKKLNIELEERIQERTKQLQQANRDLEAFAYSISHDLRAPLRHIDGFTRLLYSNIPSPDEIVTSYYQKISIASKRLSSMIDELLAFSRLGRKEIMLSPVDLRQMIPVVIENMKPEYENRNIQWIIDDLPVVNGDSALLSFAFENLIANAVKYTGKKEHAIIEIGTVKKKDFSNLITVFIKDNGAGFDMTYVDKLFGVFQRLHASDEFEGIGIGLANVKQIVDS